MFSYEEQALSSQAQRCVCSQQHTPKITFDDPYFKSMIIFQASISGGTRGQEIPTTHKKKLLEYVKSEYDVFCVLFNLIIGMKCKQIHGNMFSQGIHYGVTLTNNKNYQPLALQFIDTFWKKNLVVS